MEKSQLLLIFMKALHGQVAALSRVTPTFLSSATGRMLIVTGTELLEEVFLANAGGRWGGEKIIILISGHV